MKLDATELRYLSDDVFRTLTAVEMGSKNHEVVPSTLISQISGLRTGGVNKALGELAKRNLVARVQGAKYDGYRLTYGGYDFLAMRTFARRDTVYSVGNQIGTGKESDIYVVADEEGLQSCLKIHRLGRISFRTIKSKRDYLGKAKSASWMYMSRLAATKEYAFMKVLYENGFPVPKPVDQVRHCLVMELIDAFPLRQISEVGNPGRLYSSLMDLIVRLARAGLIHGDFNEFNILLRENDPDSDEPEPEPILIDFPQMVSTDHENAEYYFNRDVECIRAFFRRRFRYESAVYPKFTTVVTEGGRDFDLDVEIAASGWDKNRDKELRSYIETVAADGEDESGSEVEEEEEVPELVHADPEAASEVPTDKLGNLAIEEAEDQSEEESEESETSQSSSDSDQSDSSKPKREQRPSRRPKREPRNVEAIVSSNLGRTAKRQERKYHSRSAANAQTLGKAKGSKAKSDKQRTVRDGQVF